MNEQDIIRAWKDEEYRLSLTEAEQAALPSHPAGLIELTDAEMGAVVGGALPKPTKVRVTCANDCQTQRPLSGLTNCCYAFKPVAMLRPAK